MAAPQQACCMITGLDVRQRIFNYLAILILHIGELPNRRELGNIRCSFPPTIGWFLKI